MLLCMFLIMWLLLQKKIQVNICTDSRDIELGENIMLSSLTVYPQTKMTEILASKVQT